MQNTTSNFNSVTSKDLFAGVDHRSFDTRKFDPSRNDIKRLCRFFSLGNLIDYQNEKGTIISHSNFFIFVVTTQGEFAFKFYPKRAAKAIVIEYGLNRFLVDRNFPTPVMYAGYDCKPFVISNNRLATCFSYIDGQHAWQQINQKDVVIQVVSAMRSLKKILATADGRIRFSKHKSLAGAINSMTKASQALSPFEKKKLINNSLKNAYKTYQRNPSLFSRQLIHNNNNLTNFLISEETVFTLDLSHIREDYALSDLASLIVSSLFLNIPKKTVKMIVRYYFDQHKIGSEYALVLSTLVQTNLIKEYLKNVRREKSVDYSIYPEDLVRPYQAYLLARMRSIEASLLPQALYYLP